MAGYRLGLGPVAGSLDSCLAAGACSREAGAVDAVKDQRAVPLEVVAVDAVGAACQEDFAVNVP